MTPAVEVASVEPLRLAAVSGTVTFPDLAREIRRRLDLIWTHIRSNGLTPGHNVVVYRGPVHSPEGGEVDIGVQVDRFDGDSDGGVHEVGLPATTVARAVHIGPYDRLGETHAKVLAFCEQHGHTLSGLSWEIYGDRTEDVAVLETDVVYELIDG
jgi:effector-binding domain-containing protein